MMKSVIVWKKKDMGELYEIYEKCNDFWQEREEVIE